jgi:hypothetical protein
MLTQKLISRAVLSGACVLPAACATTSYSRSGVATLPPGVKGKAGANASIEIEGLKVRLESLDYAKRQDTIPTLALRLVFDPRELGYSFDPAQVALRDESGAIWSPRVYGPGQFATGAWSCTGAGVASSSAPSYHALAPGSCFELAFDVALAPQARLELALGGLARGRKRLDPVTLPLARRDGRSIDRVYWLEVLLAPLALYGGGM